MNCALGPVREDMTPGSHNTHPERIHLSALLVEGLQTVTAHWNILGTAVVVYNT